jgi:hypothetical protein
MFWLGRYFKAPPRRASRQWLKVELLHSYGERFGSYYGPTNLHVRCKTLGATVAYLVGQGHEEKAVRQRLAEIRKMRDFRADAG